MKIKIIYDLFDIAARIKEIDDGYEVYYDKSFGRYEIWKNNRLQIAVPYESLDARTLTLTRQTRVERIKTLMDEIEENNIRLASSEENRVKSEARYKAKHIVDYLSRGGRELPHYEEI